MSELEKEERIEDLYCAIQRLYFIQSDIGLFSSQEQDLWKLEQEYEKLISESERM